MEETVPVLVISKNPGTYPSAWYILGSINTAEWMNVLFTVEKLIFLSVVGKALGQDLGHLL